MNLQNYTSHYIVDVDRAEIFKYGVVVTSGEGLTRELVEVIDTGGVIVERARTKFFSGIIITRSISDNLRVKIVESQREISNRFRDKENSLNLLKLEFCSNITAICSGAPSGLTLIEGVDLLSFSIKSEIRFKII